MNQELIGDDNVQVTAKWNIGHHTVGNNSPITGNIIIQLGDNKLAKLIAIVL